MNSLNSNVRSDDQSGEYQLVKQFAHTIGLSQYSPMKQLYSPYIMNESPKKQKIRKLRHSDIRHLERQQVSKQIRFKNKVNSNIETSFRSKSMRKNSVKDVFIEYQRPENNPLIILRNKKAIGINDCKRVQRINFLSQQIRERAQQKHNRSRILGDLSSNLVSQEPFLAIHKSINNPAQNKQKLEKNWFKSPIAVPNIHTPRTQSANKLAISFDFSKFNLKQRKEGLYLTSNTYERNVQTAQTTRKTVRLKYNTNNRFEIEVNKTESESSRLFEYNQQNN